MSTVACLRGFWPPLTEALPVCGVMVGCWTVGRRQLVELQHVLACMHAHYANNSNLYGHVVHTHCEPC